MFPHLLSMAPSNTELRLISYNCRDHNSLKRKYMSSLLSRCEFLLCQEHWLSDGQLDILDEVSDSHYSTAVSGFCNTEWKKALGETQTLPAGRNNAEQQIFALPQTPFPGAQDRQNLISWRWSLPAPTDPVWWRSMHAISSYRGNRHRPPQTRPQTGPITMHCAAKLSAQCKYYVVDLMAAVLYSGLAVLMPMLNLSIGTVIGYVLFMLQNDSINLVLISVYMPCESSDIAFDELWLT